MEEEEKDPRESLRLFVSEAKVKAFCRTYSPAYDELSADAILTDAQLRKYFSAYPRAVGDPMVIYLDEYLSAAGFQLTSSSLLGEPVLPVMFK